MIAIVTRPLVAVRLGLKSPMQELPTVCQLLLESAKFPPSVTDVPTVQLAYDELPTAEIDRLLGYGGIASASSPIGLDCEFAPPVVAGSGKDQVLLFSLIGLEKHLADEEPEVVEQFRGSGSMDGFVGSRGGSLTSLEYLVAGLLCCTDFCRENESALVITW